MAEKLILCRALHPSTFCDRYVPHTACRSLLWYVSKIMKTLGRRSVWQKLYFFLRLLQSQIHEITRIQRVDTKRATCVTIFLVSATIVRWSNEIHLSIESACISLLQITPCYPPSYSVAMKAIAFRDRLRFRACKRSKAHAVFSSSHRFSSSTIFLLSITDDIFMLTNVTSGSHHRAMLVTVEMISVVTQWMAT